MILLAVSFKPKQECVSKFVEIFNNIIPIVKNEEGCIEYKFLKDLDKDEYFLFEQWESDKHLDAHLATEHMVEFFEDVKDLFLEPIDIKKFYTVD